MRKFVAIFLLLLLCASALAEAAPGTRLGYKVLLELSGGKRNAFGSPVSLAWALSMAADGAKGETRQKLLKALGAEDTDAVAALDLDVHRLCYQVAVTLPEGVASGEYEYELTADDVTVSTGVMMVTDGPNKPGQYNKPITYEQYGQYFDFQIFWSNKCYTL